MQYLCRWVLNILGVQNETRWHGVGSEHGIQAADAELAQIVQESTATLPQLDIQNMSEAE